MIFEKKFLQRGCCNNEINSAASKSAGQELTTILCQQKKKRPEGRFLVAYAKD